MIHTPTGLSQRQGLRTSSALHDLASVSSLPNHHHEMLSNSTSKIYQNDNDDDGLIERLRERLMQIFNSLLQSTARKSEKLENDGQSAKQLIKPQIADKAMNHREESQVQWVSHNGSIMQWARYARHTIKWSNRPFVAPRAVRRITYSAALLIQCGTSRTVRRFSYSAALLVQCIASFIVVPQGGGEGGGGEEKWRIDCVHRMWSQ